MILLESRDKHIWNIEHKVIAIIKEASAENIQDAQKAFSARDHCAVFFKQLGASCRGSAFRAVYG